MTQYYAVVYCKDKTIHLWPGEDQQDCVAKLMEMAEDPKIRPRMASTTVIKRDMDNFKDGQIFGCPKTYNVVKEEAKEEKSCKKQKAPQNPALSKKAKKK